MSPLLFRIPPTRAAFGWVVVVVVLLTACANDAHGQTSPEFLLNPHRTGQPVQLPDTHARKDNFQPVVPQDNWAWYRVEMAKKQEEDRAKMWTALLVWLPLTLAGIGALALLGLLGRIYMRCTTTTDPARLAQTDPWLQYHERQTNGPGPGKPGPAQDVADSPADKR
jgi:hypothetical protein